jgi:hypothetical protein
MYTDPTGGNNGCPKKYSGPGATTVTVNWQEALWPQLSVAITVTVVVPIGNVLPLGGFATIFTGGHPPLVVTV